MTGDPLWALAVDETSIVLEHAPQAVQGTRPPPARTILFLVTLSAIFLTSDDRFQKRSNNGAVSSSLDFIASGAYNSMIYSDFLLMMYDSVFLSD